MSADLEIVADVLAAEHAAVYAHGAIAAQLSGTNRAVALQGLNVHRERRDRLRKITVDAGGDPVEAQAAYELPRPMGGFSAVVDLAAGVERAVALAYGVLVANSDADEREFAASALQDAAVREAFWHQEAPRFPGLEDPGLPPEAPTPAATAS